MYRNRNAGIIFRGRAIRCLSRNLRKVPFSAGVTNHRGGARSLQRTGPRGDTIFHRPRGPIGLLTAVGPTDYLAAGATNLLTAAPPNYWPPGARSHWLLAHQLMAAGPHRLPNRGSTNSLAAGAPNYWLRGPTNLLTAGRPNF